MALMLKAVNMEAEVKFWVLHTDGVKLIAK